MTIHVFRKSGYLLATWGGVRIKTIRNDARHTCIETSAQYEQDAVAQLAAEQILDPKAEYQVPRYVYCLIYKV